LSLWLTLPSLLLGTTISVNSASAADDMVAENLNNEVITDQDKTDISLLAPMKYVSRAEFLFGNNTMVSHEDIGKALRGE
jgi:hypothetical protein